MARPSSSSNEIIEGEETPGILTPTNMAFGFEGRISMLFGALVFMSQLDYSVYLDDGNVFCG